MDWVYWWPLTKWPRWVGAHCCFLEYLHKHATPRNNLVVENVGHEMISWKRETNCGPEHKMKWGKWNKINCSLVIQCERRKLMKKRNSFYYIDITVCGVKNILTAFLLRLNWKEDTYKTSHKLGSNNGNWGLTIVVVCEGGRKTESDPNGWERQDDNKKQKGKEKKSIKKEGKKHNFRQLLLIRSLHLVPILLTITQLDKLKKKKKKEHYPLTG